MVITLLFNGCSLATETNNLNFNIAIINKLNLNVVKIQQVIL